jgi:hypothetical protein
MRLVCLDLEGVLVPEIWIAFSEAAGILAEASGGTVYLGMGINLAQRVFPPELAGKAASIAGTLAGYGAFAGKGAAGGETGPADTAARRFALLEAILARLHTELESAAGTDWRERLEERLFMKGRRVVFVPGQATAENSGSPAADGETAENSGGGPRIVEGILRGVGEVGALLFEPEDSGGHGEDSPALSFVPGELRVY